MWRYWQLCKTGWSSGTGPSRCPSPKRIAGVSNLEPCSLWDELRAHERSSGDFDPLVIHVSLQVVGNSR